MEQRVTPPLKIAVVDDDVSVLDAVQMVLEDHSLNVCTYNSGEKFLNDIKFNQPDCIILDSNLPGLSGIAVANTITASQKNIPIIILTAYPESSQTLKIKELRNCDVLVKPVTAEVLLKHIQKSVIQ